MDYCNAQNKIQAKTKLGNFLIYLFFYIRILLTRIPNTGNSTSGIIEVIGKGSASVTQKNVMISTTYIHRNC